MATRTLMLAAALGLSGALLAGCGDDGNDSEAEEATQNGESSSQASEEQTSGEASDTNDEGDTQTASADPVSLIFGTGGTGGTYYPIGGALKGVFEASDLVDGVQVVSTGASVQNINNITDGLNQIAIVMSDVAYDAVNGENQFDGQPADIQALAGLYPNASQD